MTKRVIGDGNAATYVQGDWDGGGRSLWDMIVMLRLELG